MQADTEYVKSGDVYIAYQGEGPLDVVFASLSTGGTKDVSG